MAACNLKINLSDPKRVTVAGEKISGEVLVNVEQTVNCKGLLVSSRWTTHGRGNTDHGEVDSQEVFQGTWQPGEYRYPFELRTAHWPPTYYGTLLNVSHSIQAQAKLAWAVDPKASVEFPLYASQSPAGLEPTKKKTNLGLIGWIVLGIVMLLFSFMFLFLVPIILVVGGTVWFFTSYLPKSRTGNVNCQVNPARAKAGQAIACSMEFTPKRKTTINAVRATVVCEEKCVSGSGSNRTTHRQELTSHVESLMDAGQILPGQRQLFTFDYPLPTNAPPSLDLSDNDLNWYVEFRIDIPKWPDFVKKIPVIVEPSAEMQQAAAAHAASAGKEPSWLDQVIKQLMESAESPERLALVLNAIQGHEFDMALEIEQPTSVPLQAGGLAGGTWLEAFDDTHELDVLLHFRDGINVPSASSIWRGRTHIVGFDAEDERIIASVVA